MEEGGTRDKYMKFENAGDQYLGRILSGLNTLSPGFAVMPPYFDAKTRPENEMVDDFIWTRLENANNISDGLFQVIRYCFASLCFHYHFLTNTLQPTSRIRTSAIFMNVPKEIMEMAKVFLYNQVKDANGEGNAPRITGIPLHMVLLVSSMT